MQIKLSNYNLISNILSSNLNSFIVFYSHYKMYSNKKNSQNSI